MSDEIGKEHGWSIFERKASKDDERHCFGVCLDVLREPGNYWPQVAYWWDSAAEAARWVRTVLVPSLRRQGKPIERSGHPRIGSRDYAWRGSLGGLSRVPGHIRAAL